MKISLNIKAKLQHLFILNLFLILSVILSNCKTDIHEFDPGLDELVITEYVDKYDDKYAEFGKVMYATGLNNLLRVRGPFTLMLPTDDAMLAYYERKGVSTHSEIDAKELSDFVYNHIFQGQINSGLIGQGTLLYKNGLGDKVACDLVDTDIQLNKSAFIIDRDIFLSNGIVHIIDHTLDPITESIYEVLSAIPGYSIFTKGLEMAGLKDTLQLIRFPYGNADARTEFTLLAVPDTLYNRMGISNISSLIDMYSDSDDITNNQNGFYKYMEYHCLHGSHYFSEFTTGNDGDIYYLISYDNYINIKVSIDYQINESGDVYTGFYNELSNIPAKNGVIHTVNDMLPAIESEPAAFDFQTTDYFDLQQGSYYGNNYARFYDGQNTFEYIKWDAEYLMYYFKNEDLFWDTDGLALSGHFWIELTLPKIRKGTYRISPYWFGDGLYTLYVDGEYFADIDMSTNPWNSYYQIDQTITFDETKEHKIRLETAISSGIFWDRIRFTPVN